MGKNSQKNSEKGPKIERKENIEKSVKNKETITEKKTKNFWKKQQISSLPMWTKSLKKLQKKVKK